MVVDFFFVMFVCVFLSKVSEYARNRPPPLNTSIGHRRTFTPINVIPDDPLPSPKESNHDLTPPARTSANLEPQSYSPHPSPIHAMRAPSLSRSQSHAV